RRPVSLDIGGLDVLKVEVAPILVTELGHSVSKRLVQRRVGGLHADIADPQHLRLRFCARRDRPRCRRAAEQRDELAAFHSVTSSARASTVAGTSRPSALAVLRLITNSYLVGA